jgi:hypothetical protein
MARISNDFYELLLLIHCNFGDIFLENYQLLPCLDTIGPVVSGKKLKFRSLRMTEGWTSSDDNTSASFFYSEDLIIVPFSVLGLIYHCSGVDSWA